MPSSCCVIGCKSRGNAQPGVVFFQLPLNKPGVLTQWLIVLDRRDWIPKPSSRICSLHFYPDDYIMKPNQSNSRLKPDAIPSIFPDLGGDDKEEEKEENKDEIAQEEEESPKPSPKPKPVDGNRKPLSSLPTTPVGESPSQRPRRAPKVSSKMKDFILLDEIKKTPRQSSPAVPSKKDTPVAEGDKAAQELLSILEDSNSLSGDEKTPKPRPVDAKKSSVPTLNIKKQSTAVSTSATKSLLKPMPASVKKERAEKAAASSGESPHQGSIDLPKAAKPVPVAFRKTYFQVKNGNKVLFLSYADLNPVADMTKNNALYLSNDHALVKSDTAVENTGPATPQDGHATITLPESKNLKFKSLEVVIPEKAPVKIGNNSIDVNENAISNSNFGDDSHHEDSEVFDSDSGLVQLSERGIASTGIKKISKNFKVTSPVKRKKRFKAVAEIVVRTDNTGQVPSVSIEKMTNLETPDAPRKKLKVGSHVPVSISHLPPEITPQDAELLALAQRIAGTIKHMQLLDSVNGDTSKLTVLITTLPPVKEHELLVIKKKDTITNIEEVKELLVTISSTTSTTTTTVEIGGKHFNVIPKGVPILGVSTSGEIENGGGENKAIEETVKTPPLVTEEAPPPVAQEAPPLVTEEAPPLVTEEAPPLVAQVASPPVAQVAPPPVAQVTPPSVIAINAQASVEEGKADGAAPLQHDHTYISPSMKIAEAEAAADDHSKEISSNSKLKLTEEEISYRNKAQKKLRILKETVKRKNETIAKLKEKISFLEKSLREEKRMKRKLALMSRRRGGIDMADGYEGDLKSDLQVDEDGDYSDEDGRGRSRSPITYICEPAIDVCEKQILA